MVVITELEGKRHHPELGYFARRRCARSMSCASRTADWTSRSRSVTRAAVRVELNHTDAESLPSGFRLGDNDTRILAVALQPA